MQGLVDLDEDFLPDVEMAEAGSIFTWEQKTVYLAGIK